MYNDEEIEKKKKEDQAHHFWNPFRKRTKRLLADVDRMFNKILWCEIEISTALILIGIIFLVNPDVGEILTAIVFGILAVCFGVLNLYSYFKRKEIPFFKFHFIYGCIGIGLGLFSIFNPFLFHTVLTIGIGLWFIYLAATKLDLALCLKMMNEESWLIHLTTAFVIFVMALLILINPFKNLLLTQLAGAYLILCGILNIADIFLTRKRAVDFLENL